MIRADYVIVGAGLTGLTIARRLTDAGRDVLLLEKRPHAGGNVRDEVDPASGVRIHPHGPHYFRTSSPRIWDWAQRFGEFWHYEARIQTISPDAVMLPWPLQKSVAGAGTPVSNREPVNFEEAALTKVSTLAYERYIKPYTEKQWGLPAIYLEAALANRITVNPDGEDRLSPQATWQGIPRYGYTAWLESMVCGIPTITNFDYLKFRREVECRCKLIFTGPCDHFYDCDLGVLAYRCQRREHTWHNLDSVLPVAQVNTPRGTAVRHIEWRKLMPPEQAARCQGTVTTSETPDWARTPDEFEYPFPDRRNRELARQYQARAKADGVIFAGRLGRNQYLDMDQAIGAALHVADDLLEDA